MRELVEVAGLELPGSSSAPGRRGDALSATAVAAADSGGAGEDEAPARLLEATDQAMLDYVLKLTRTPAEVRSEDVTALRRAGFDDRAVHDICAIAAYFAFVNRIADGLGVELE